MRARGGGGVGCKYGKGDAGSGRILGCPPAESETSIASKAWAWCAARSRTQFYREENVGGIL